MKSECKRMTVHVMGVDYDGNIAYFKNYNETECTGEIGKCGCIHAEIALLKEMPNPKAIVVSISPCMDCAKALVESGVELVYFLKPYRKTDGWDYLYQNGVITRPITL